MILLSVKDIRQCINGQLIQGSDDFKVHDIIYHQEKIDQNKLLFLRQKWKIDWEKISKSTPCVVVTDIIFPELEKIGMCTVIKVENIESAFWKFVDFYRDQFSIPVVSITGTNGKSTTKDMIKHILNFDHKVTGTKKSANSRTHNLTYLLSIEKDTDAAVFESAVGKPGDVILASKYFKPTIGIITNIGVYHLDGCKTPEAYIQAKAEMIQAVGSNGTLIVNADDENIKKMGIKSFKGKLLTFGINNRANFKASKIQYDQNGMRFELTYKKGKYSIFNKRYPVFVPGYGQHQVLNALAAIAAAFEMGIGIKESASRIRTFSNLPSHFECIITKGGYIIVDDTWSSTPSSLIAAIETLNGISNGRKKVALIGDFKRLGDLSLEYHYQVGEKIAEIGVDTLITVGPLAAVIAERAKTRGLKGDVYSFPDIQGVELLLEKILDKNSILLIKCSSTNQPIVKLKSKLKRG
ncbi:UDP-N-acetylmuramoyl-tripeptide--D-alanyl-D-alanine ligase [Bacillus sp. S/N-304-OC-R1]|uniref:UDP-N-acetylmuramoyl-tripeptide--D-alanyl-D- alanine ligase n=1 Tax=Bacillus sp. S/N-304-OC-R1 TaxID=2758034 RepID=UPI001C8E04A0|nr:UDP-N-acetylmuramoyl-tripeptide--D-alanyl-D-alanine ligase [Bacillus sp. S/N-304-OC-R1]MBY0121557.1 UDP-N-acetylmuramoyl-tripeptide--D-alanyl-D-alanine ligase [Bacillus sp. S/N-304-OC-R1]